MFLFPCRSLFGDDDNVEETLGIKPKPDTTEDTNKTAEKLITNDEVHVFIYRTAFLVFFLSFILDYIHDKYQLSQKKV